MPHCWGGAVVVAATVQYSFDAISENKYRWRDTSHAKAVLGWQPTGTADLYNPDDYRSMDVEPRYKR